MRKKKEKVFQHGIEITKPWSREMYAHNDKVSTEVRDEVWERWAKAYKEIEERELEKGGFSESEWEYNVHQHLRDIQKAVTVIGYGSGYTVKDVEEDVIDDLENAPYYRLNEIVEELDIELESEFIGF